MVSLLCKHRSAPFSSAILEIVQILHSPSLLPGMCCTSATVAPAGFSPWEQHRLHIPGEARHRNPGTLSCADFSPPPSCIYHKRMSGFHSPVAHLLSSTQCTLAFGAPTASRVAPVLHSRNSAALCMPRTPDRTRPSAPCSACTLVPPCAVYFGCCSSLFLYDRGRRGGASPSQHPTTAGMRRRGCRRITYKCPWLLASRKLSTAAAPWAPQMGASHSQLFAAAPSRNGSINRETLARPSTQANPQEYRPLPA